MNDMTSMNEMPQRRRQTTCGHCGQAGHNRRTCPSRFAGHAPTNPASGARAHYRQWALGGDQIRGRGGHQDAARERQREEMDRARWAREAAEVPTGPHSPRSPSTSPPAEVAEVPPVPQRAREQAQAQSQRTPANQERMMQLMRQAQDDAELMAVARRIARRMSRPRPAAAQHPEDEIDLKRMAELPVLRATAIEMDECPICIEPLGETGKVVLKCGHSVCQGCFLQQVLMARGADKLDKCVCPMCRVNYIK